MPSQHDAKYGANLGTIQHAHDECNLLKTWAPALSMLGNWQSHIQQADDSLLPVVLVASFLQVPNNFLQDLWIYMTWV